MKKYFVIVISLLLLLLSGCGSDDVITPKGDVSAELKDKSINSGETTILEITGKNTGELTLDVVFKIVPDNAENVKLLDGDSFTETLNPSDEVTRAKKVQGLTKSSKAEEIIKIQMLNNATGLEIGSTEVNLVIKG